MKRMAEKVYACIDLKSFYASVECRERGLSPLDTNLVVADKTRTDGTICLAVTPSLKAEGVPGRPRLFEVREKVREINWRRLNRWREQQGWGKGDTGVNRGGRAADRGGAGTANRGGAGTANRGRRKFTGKSYLASELAAHPDWALDFLVVPPRMRKYMEYSARIYGVYLEFVSAVDILVYSIDEVFMDLTDYVRLYQMSAEELVAKMIERVHEETGITATAGVGTNLYLAKVAMDITAKHMEPNALGVRMASLDERSYRRKLWAHQPLTDFWRVGRGYARKLAAHGIYTMGDVARVSLDNEDLLFRLFGVNAEYLIDHAWGEEPTTLAEAKAYRPAVRSLSRGQVLHGAYDVRRARVVVKEMVDELTLKMVEKGLVAKQFVLAVAWTGAGERQRKEGGGLLSAGDLRNVDGLPSAGDLPSRARRQWVRTTINFDHRTASAKLVMARVSEEFVRLVRPDWRIRKLNLTANEVVDENLAEDEEVTGQLDLFGEYLRRAEAQAARRKGEQRERRMQRAMIDIKRRYGKNAILRAMDFEEGATTRERNREVGGHRE